MKETKLKISAKKLNKTKSRNYSAIDKALIQRINSLSKKDNKIWDAPNYNRRENVHGFFQYPAMMVPIVQKNIVEAIICSKPRINTMIDPYMGAATSIVACMQSGLNCYGQDINPLAVLISKVKTSSYFYESFQIRAKAVISFARNSKSSKIVKTFSGRDKWFKEEVSIELSRLVKAIRNENTLSTRRLFWVTLAEVVRLTSNDRTSTFKLHARTKKEIKSRVVSPIDVFEILIEKNIEDIKTHATFLKEHKLISRGIYKYTVSVSLEDSLKKINHPGKKAFFDLLVSSPPYGDNKTTIPYGQHAYLPLQWIDLHDIDVKASQDFLRTTLEIDARSLGGKIKNISIADVESLFIKSPTLKKTVKCLSNSHSDKIKKVLNFIYDFDKSLEQIVKSVKSNGYFVWTIGNRNVGQIEIRNDKILTELMYNRGANLIKVISRKIVNKRMALRNSSSETMNEEKILIFRKAK